MARRNEGSGAAQRGLGARFVRGVLIFTAGALVGANAVYYVLRTRSPAPPMVIAPPAGSPAPSSGAAPAVQRAPMPGAIAPALPTAPTGPVATSPDGAHVVPVAGIRPDQLVDTFTQSRNGGRRHDAIDIMAAAGTPVLAAVDGRVVKLFASDAGGITLYQFDNAERFVYYYAHLQGYAPDIAEGRVLKKGEVLGYVGATGNANPAAPHLHFAIALLDADKRWHAGTPVNPYPLLSGRPAAPVQSPAAQTATATPAAQTAKETPAAQAAAATQPAPTKAAPAR